MPSKIIIDTDPGVDDVLAILLGLASPEVDVAAITIVFGNTHAPAAHANLLKIYHQISLEIAAFPEAASRYSRLAGAKKTILALGEDGPIGGEKAVAAYFHGPDGLSNISVTHPHFTPPTMAEDDIHEHLEVSKKPAYEVMLDVLAEEPEGTVTIVALGPLTNVAKAYRSSPETFRKASRVMWMGGALDVPGNTSPVAEFNTYADPYAAAEILDHVKKGEFKLIMAPLDITTPHQIPFDELIHPKFVPGSTISKPEPTPLETFVSAMLIRVRGLHVSLGLPDAMEMHDPVATWFAIANCSNHDVHSPAEGWVLRKRDFKIERNGELTRGMCVVDRRGTGETVQGNRVETGLEANKVEEKKVEGNTPWVIVKTPGSEVLRSLLLSRVFGIAA